MRILIITDPITPPSYAPRVMATYRYLKAAGHDCVLESGELVQASVLEKLLRCVDRQFGHRLEKQYASKRFDIILCSTYYYFPLWTARYLSKKWHIPYVVDLRDIVEQWGSSSYFITPLPKLLGLERMLAKCYEKRNIRFRNHVLDKAKAVMSVSPWHCECLRQQTSTPVHLVYNGFDAEELSFVAQTSEIFHIAYIGRIINLDLRQPQLLFQALGELHKERKITPEQVHLDFYAESDMETKVRHLADEYKVNDYLHWLPFVDRAQLNDVMAKSSILVALACPPQQGQHGILGTKVFEAIGVEKPLLLVPSDEDSLAALIKETGIGLAATQVDETKAFIVDKYHEWQRNGYTHQQIVNKGHFNRQTIAHDIETLLSHSTHL